LKFDEQIEDHLAVSPPEFPDQIIFALSPIISHITPIAPLQGTDITDSNQFGIKVPQNKICHHVRIAEQTFVWMIEISHYPQSSSSGNHRDGKGFGKV
jgi:hypothetical protein